MIQNPQDEELEAIAEPTLGHSTDTTTSSDITLNNNAQSEKKKKKVNEDEDSQLIKESFKFLHFDNHMLLC